jgi:hypothetical protein
MSGGRKKKQEQRDFSGPNVVTLDQEEFNAVCKRVHSFLLSRAEKAKKKCDVKPTKRSSALHIEASKEVFVFIHLLELVESMTEEISDLRTIISNVQSDDSDDSTPTPQIFSQNRKRFLN